MDKSITYDVIVVGAGPGGLATAMQLAGTGAKVALVEKADRPGGRMKNLRFDGYTCDTGPSILQGPQVLGEVFHRAGLHLADHVDLLPVDPMFRMIFWDGTKVVMPRDNGAAERAMEALKPGAGAGYRAYMEEHRRKYEVAYAGFIRAPADSLLGYYSLPKLLKAAPFRPWQNLFRNLDGFFGDERLNYAFSYPSKYLGLTPHTCSSVFSVIPYLEQAFGVWHPKGGFGELSATMLRCVQQLGGDCFLGQPVTAIRVKEGRAAGVALADGTELSASEVVVNADFAWAQRLLPAEARRTWTDTKVGKLKFSCSTFMMYLGLDVELPLEHHVIYLSDHVRKGRERYSQDEELDWEDPPFYLCNPGATDRGFAPAGHSAIYVLVPTPNLKDGTDWAKEQERYYEKMLAHVGRVLGLGDLAPHVRARRLHTAQTWEEEYNVRHGAVFNLAHSFDQLGPLRPRSRSEDVAGLHWVGGGTHPGSGLITIFENALQVADRICGPRLPPLKPLPDESLLPVG